METASLNRIADRDLHLQKLVANLNVSPQITRLFAARLRSKLTAFDEPVASLRRKQLVYMVLCLTTGAVSLGLPWTVSGTGARGLLASCLLTVGFIFLRRSQSARTERWLRTHIARLGLATELLGLVERHPIVRTYVECAVEVYPWLSGLDVQIAHKLAKQDDNPSLPAEMTEAVALQRLRCLPYSDDIFT